VGLGLLNLAILLLGIMLIIIITTFISSFLIKKNKYQKNIISNFHNEKFEKLYLNLRNQYGKELKKKKNKYLYELWKAIFAIFILFLIFAILPSLLSASSGLFFESVVYFLFMSILIILPSYVFISENRDMELSDEDSYKIYYKERIVSKFILGINSELRYSFSKAYVIETYNERLHENVKERIEEQVKGTGIENDYLSSMFENQELNIHIDDYIEGIMSEKNI